MKCEVCGKGYQTRSGLRRHVKSVHAGKGAAGEVVTKDEAGPNAVVAMVDVVDATRYPDDARSKPLREGCKALGIKLNDVMSFKVYDDKVVIIEGPTGWKRVWQRN